MKQKGYGVVRRQNKVFISYRREDSSGYVGRLYDRLVAHVGRARVLRDIDTIPIGADFEKVLEKHLQESAVCLVVIGDKWVSLFRDRQAGPRDYVRFEVGNALKMDCVVIPVLVGRAGMPTQEELQSFPDIAPIARRNAITMRDDINFENDFGRLIKAIEPSRSILTQIASSVGCLLILLSTGFCAWTKLFPIEPISEYPTEDDIRRRDPPIPTDNVERRIPDLVIGRERFIWVDPSGETPFYEERKYEEFRKELEKFTANSVSKLGGFYLQSDKFSNESFIRSDTTDYLNNPVPPSAPIKLLNLSSADEKTTTVSKLCQQYLFGESKPAAIRFRLPSILEWHFAASDVLLERKGGSKFAQSEYGFSGFFNGLPELVTTDEAPSGYGIVGVDTDDTATIFRDDEIARFIEDGSPSENSRFTMPVGMRLAVAEGDKSRTSTVYTKNKTQEELLILAYKSGHDGKSLEEGSTTWPVSSGREDRPELKQLGLIGWHWIVIYSRVKMKSGESIDNAKRKFRERVAGWCHFGYLEFSILEIENHGDNLRFDSVLFR